MSPSPEIRADSRRTLRRMPDELSKVLSTATIASLASAPSHERGTVLSRSEEVGPL